MTGAKVDHPQFKGYYVHPKKQEAFLVALRKCNLNVTKASKMIGLAGPRNLWKQRKYDPEFAQLWDEVEDEVLDNLEEMEFEDAAIRPEDRRFVLQRRRANRWSEKHMMAVQAQVEVNTPIHELSDAQLQQIAATAVAQLPAPSDSEDDSQGDDESAFRDAEQHGDVSSEE